MWTTRWPGSTTTSSGRPSRSARVNVVLSTPAWASAETSSRTYTFIPPLSPEPGCSSGDVWSEITAARCTTRADDNKGVRSFPESWVRSQRTGCQSGRLSTFGFAVAVATDQLGAQRIELIEAGTAIGRHLRLELGDRLGEGEEFCVVEGLQPSEAPGSAQFVEFDGERMIAQVLGGSRRACGPTGQVARQHGAEFLVDDDLGVGRAVFGFGLHEIESSLGDTARVRHGVVFELQLLAQATEFVQREVWRGRAAGSWSRGSSGHGWQDRHLVMLADGGVDRDVLAVHPHPAGAEHVGEPGAIARFGGGEHLADGRRRRRRRFRFRQPRGPRRTDAVVGTAINLQVLPTQTGFAGTVTT